MANTIEEFRTSLERFDRPDRVDGLVVALGLVPCRVPADPELVGALIPAGLNVPVQAWTVAERQSLLLSLLVFVQPVKASAITGFHDRLVARDPTRQHLLVVCPADFDTVTLAAPGLDGAVRHVTIKRLRPRRTDLETLCEMVACQDEGGTAMALRYALALDRSRVTASFFRDFRAQRERVATSWLGVPRSATIDRMALALLFLCRLLFLYFLRRRHLANEPDFLVGPWRAWLRAGQQVPGFFKTVLEPLFFGVLNTQPANRAPEARLFGDLPYLNGGLFERTVRERNYPDLDLPDSVVAAVFDDLFERYRFTAVEPTDPVVSGEDNVGVDPAMLGRVFEGLMAPGDRGRTGTFFTPPRVVDEIVASAIAAYLDENARTRPVGGLSPGDGPGADARSRLHLLRGIRVLDPACGSGAFLLGALTRIAAMRESLGDDSERVRARVVARSLHGVDIQADAALLCALRLWLALTVPAGPADARNVAPLPNLDRRVRQGDALLDPFDLAFPDSSSLPAAFRVRLQRQVRTMAPVARRYLDSEPGEREDLQQRLREMEVGFAALWMEGWSAGAANHQSALRRRAAQRDLWGNETRDAHTAHDELRRLDDHQREIDRLRSDLHESGSLPFFSFPVHFPEASLNGFDLILMNPPWVRPHRWPASLRGLVRRRYAVCREPGWRPAAGTGRSSSGGQVDLAMLFLERAIGLLAPGGALGTLLPAKTLRSLFAGPARRILLQNLHMVRIDDYSLDQRALFEADAFAMSLVAVKPLDMESRNEARAEPGSRPTELRITMRRPGVAPLHFGVAPQDLPLVPDDLTSPWLLAPRPVRDVLRRMQESGTPLGSVAGLRIRRGIETGANDVLIAREVAPRLAGLASIRADGAFRSGTGSTSAADFEATIEDAALLPLVRGTDVTAWSFDIRRYLIRHELADRSPVDWPRLRRYLDRHRSRRILSGAGRPQPTRASTDHRVVWHDLADTLRAVAVPCSVRTVFGDARTPIPLNTVYQVETEDKAEALRLAAFLNSTPIRVFAATIAERAKDAHFRFFAWTVSVLPLPDALWYGRDARSIERISTDAHVRRSITGSDQEDLDAIVARGFGLTQRELEALLQFGKWLHGRRA